MCRHCERLVEDVEHKELVHRFMEVSAEKINRKLRETEPGAVITADDITLEFHFRILSPIRRIIKDLDEMHK